MPRAVPMNKAQLWKLSNVGYYTEDCEIVVDADSYDAELECFDIKCKIKDDAPDSVWRGVQVQKNGWIYLTVWEDGTIEPKEWS